MHYTKQIVVRVPDTIYQAITSDAAANQCGKSDRVRQILQTHYGEAGVDD